MKKRSGRVLLSLFVSVLMALWCNRAIAAPHGAYRLILGEDRKNEVAAQRAEQAVSEAAEHAYVRQSRAVVFDTSLLALTSPLSVGDVIILDLLSNVTYSIVIDNVTRDQFGSLSILGTIEGSQFSTVNITANNGRIIGTIQDMDKNKLFRIRCSGAGHIHEILDYDVENMPDKVALPPLQPPPDSGDKERL